MRASLARSLLYGEVGKTSFTKITLLISRAMTASTFEFATRVPQLPRRRSKDRRTRNRLRELCDEVLASYRLAQGEDVVTPEDREIANQVLRKIAPVK
jgi:hypothetical protein